MTQDKTISLIDFEVVHFVQYLLDVRKNFLGPLVVVIAGDQ